MSTIKRQHYYLWLAVDAKEQVLDILMQRHCNKRVGKKFSRKLLKLIGFAQCVMVTDKLIS
ncbi:MAG: DDE-type integrase/transposase/recombinase [Cyanobacteria bacterium P01_D01_bin.71]